MGEGAKKEEARSKGGGRRRKADEAKEAAGRSTETRDKVVALAGGIGVEIPEEAGKRAALNVQASVRELGRELGWLSEGAGLFRMGESFYTVDGRSGELRVMNADRFISWVEEVAWTYRPAGEAVKFARFPKDMAVCVLASDIFRGAVRELRGVHEVRLPVWRGDGEGRRVELLPEGYDTETGIYTVDAVPFDKGLGESEAVEWLLDVLGDYPWAEEARSPRESRSCAAHVAAMLSPFCRLMLPEGAKQIMIIYNGNQPGTGKSTLARMALAPVYGSAAAKSINRNPEELRKVLETAAIERKPYVFLDDCADVKSHELNMFVTSMTMSARVLQHSRSEEMQILAQVFATGNALTVTPDVERRALVADLFLESDPQERRFGREITEAWLIDKGTRGRFLAALWALVRWWQEQGGPWAGEAYRPSFEEHSRLVGSVVIEAGFSNPFAKRESEMGGDERGEAMRELLRALAGSLPDGGEEAFTTDDLLEKADDLALTELLVGYAKNEKMALGQQLRKLKGREFKDGKGRPFKFGNRKGNKGAIYPIKMLTPPPKGGVG